jgi:hypothetical protein
LLIDSEIIKGAVHLGSNNIGLFVLLILILLFGSNASDLVALLVGINGILGAGSATGGFVRFFDHINGIVCLGSNIRDLVGLLAGC